MTKVCFRVAIVVLTAYLFLGASFLGAPRGQDGAMSSDAYVPPEHGLEPLPHEPPVHDPVLDKKAAPSGKPPKLKDEAGRFTRAGALWTALAVGFVVLIVLLVFIMQNTDTQSSRVTSVESTMPAVRNAPSTEV